MACYHPLQGWYSRSLTKTGKRAVVFNLDEGYVDLPVEVPCGQCVGCRLERVRSWAIRMVHEAKQHPVSWFSTFTYRPEDLPPRGSLVKEDFQKFLKRLRRSKGAGRYFMCGEYGGISGRPHYHAVLYGWDFPDKRLISKPSLDGHCRYRSEELTRLWGLGETELGTLSFQSASYVAGYVVKKMTGERAEEWYRRVDPETGEVYQLVPEYCQMSLKPGIGDLAYYRWRSDFFPADEVIVDGKPAKVPRRYDVLLEKEDPAQYKLVKARRRTAALQDAVNQTPERLAVREGVVISKQKLFSKRGKV